MGVFTLNVVAPQIGKTVSSLGSEFEKVVEHFGKSQFGLEFRQRGLLLKFSFSFAGA
jgi:hypothetical protein